jgi:hypothetical protein
MFGEKQVMKSSVLAFWRGGERYESALRFGPYILAFYACEDDLR